MEVNVQIDIFFGQSVAFHIFHIQKFSVFM